MPKKVQSLEPPNEVTRAQQAESSPASWIAAFITEDGYIFEVAEAGDDLGRTTALASEGSLSRLWGATEEDELCRIFREET